MSGKNFLQELESIKRKVEICYDEYPTGDDTALQLTEIKEAIQGMINQCIEIQLHVMKEQNAKNFYKKDV